MAKVYPFSMKKHAHELDLVSHLLAINFTYNDNAPAKLRDWANETRMHIADILALGIGCKPIVYLTGEQIALTKSCIFWADEFRAMRQNMSPEEIIMSKPEWK